MAESWLFPIGDHAVLRNTVVAMVTLAVGFGMVAGAPAPGSSAAMEPGASGEDGAYCVRPMVDVIWGFLLTLLALFISAWGSLNLRRMRTTEGNLERAYFSAFFGTCQPLYEVHMNIMTSWLFIFMLWKYHKHKNEGSNSWLLLKDLCSSLLPRSKFPLRILVTCDIVLCVRKELQLVQRHDCEYLEDVTNNRGVSESEAMVIGDQTMVSRKMEISPKLLFALLLADYDHPNIKVLPDYDQLKFLRGNSGFATIAIAVQAFGYIYAVLFRSFILGMQVAPVEVLGLILNLIILIKTSLFSTCNPCYRRLVIYMNPEQEGQLLTILHNDVNEPSKRIQLPNVEKLSSVCVIGVGLGLSIVLIYFIVSVMKGTNIVVRMPLIIFAVTTVLGILVPFYLDFDLRNIMNLNIKVIMVSNLVVYIWAIVVTILRWKSEHFNAQGHLHLLDLSQLIPFIG